MPGPESPPARSSDLSSPDMVPEIPLDDYVKNFRYVPPADPGEITMRGEAPGIAARGSGRKRCFPRPPQRKQLRSGHQSHFSTEDVDERLGLEDLAPDDERRDRPRFLDFNEPTAPPEKPEARVPAIVGPSFLGLGDTPPLAAPSRTVCGLPNLSGGRGPGLPWPLFLVFVVLGVLEWRSQVNQTNNGPVEVIKMKIRNMWRGSSPAPQAAGFG